MGIDKNAVVVWDGIIVLGEKEEGKGDFTVTWHGQLEVHENAADSKGVKEIKRNAFQAFCDSDKEFRVVGKATPVDGTEDGNRFKAYKVSFNEGEGWDLDGKKHKDETNDVLTSLQWQGSPDKRKSLVYGVGKDEYGAFVSAGWMRPGNRITIARRYLGDGDDRAGWSLENVQEETLKVIYDDDEEEVTVMPPWQCAVFDAK